MGGYGGAADARAVYGAGYGGQPAQANSYGIPGSSVPASQYSQYGKLHRSGECYHNFVKCYLRQRSFSRCCLSYSCLVC